MIMKPFFISLSVLFAVITTASSQSKLVFRDKFMYSDTQIFHAKKEFTISSLIDTGCSLCILDSIFAIDSCGIKENTLETIYVNLHIPEHTRSLSGGLLGHKIMP